MPGSMNSPAWLQRPSTTRWGRPSAPQRALLYIWKRALACSVLAVPARCWKRAFSAQGTSPPMSAWATGAKPSRRNAERRTAKRRRMGGGVRGAGITEATICLGGRMSASDSKRGPPDQCPRFLPSKQVVTSRRQPSWWAAGCWRARWHPKWRNMRAGAGWCRRSPPAAMWRPCPG